MLHAKFQDHRTYGSGEEDSKGLKGSLLFYYFYYTVYRHGGNLGHVTWTININFLYPLPRRFHIKFGFDWPSSFRGEDV